eukprot:1139885-Pelagomonas_calceolata.AAC.6
MVLSCELGIYNGKPSTFNCTPLPYSVKVSTHPSTPSTPFRHSHGNMPRVADYQATNGHAAPQHVFNRAALTGLASQCWLGCSTLGKPRSHLKSGLACTRLALHQEQASQAQGQG